MEIWGQDPGQEGMNLLCHSIPLICIKLPLSSIVVLTIYNITVFISVCFICDCKRVCRLKINYYLLTYLLKHRPTRNIMNRTQGVCLNGQQVNHAHTYTDLWRGHNIILKQWPENKKELLN